MLEISNFRIVKQTQYYKVYSLNILGQFTSVTDISNCIKTFS